MFPIIDLLLKNVELPMILYVILALYIFIQIYSSSFWPGIPYTVNYNSNVGNVLHFVFQVAFMSSLDESLSDLTMVFSILLTLSLIMIFIISIQVSIYKIKRRLVRWTLFPTKFVIEFLPLMLLMPTGNFIGMVFDAIHREAKLINIIFLAFGIIIFIIMLCVEYVQSYCFSMSPYIPKSIIFSFYGGFYLAIFSVIPLFLVSPYLFRSFGHWIDPFLIFLKMLFNIYIVYNTFFMPFVRRKTNFVFAAVFASSTVLDLTAFIITLGYFITELIQLVICIFCLILFYIFFYFIMNWHFNRVKKNISAKVLEKLSTNKENETSKTTSEIDEATRNYYFSLKLHKRINKFNLYLRVGLESMSPMFLDWSLIKFASDFVEDKSLLLQMTKIVCLFPCESRLLRLMLSKCLDIQSLKFHERFMIYQIRSVMNQRQSASSTEINVKLTELRQSSIKGIKLVRDFWNNIPDNPDIFYQIYDSTIKVSDYYNEAIIEWPHCIQLYKDFATFQIECGADFVNGVKSSYKSSLIEQGKNYAIDYSFRSLVHLYPYYLKRNVIDIKGNFIRSVRKSGSASSSLSSRSDLSSNTMSGELDIDIEESVSSSLFSHHRLRIALQRAVENKRSRNSVNLKLTAVFALVLLCLTLIFLQIYLSSVFSSRITNLESSRTLESVRIGFDIGVTSLLLKWGDALGLINKQFIEDVHSTSTNSIDTFDDPVLEALKWIFYGMNNLTSFMDALVIMGTNGEKVIKEMKPAFEDLMIFNFCDGFSEIPKAINTSLRHAFAYSFDQARELIQLRSEARDWNTSSNMCTIFSNIDDLYFSYDSLQRSMISRQIEDKKQAVQNNYLIMIVATIAFVVITAPVLFTFLFKYIFELKSYVRMLNNIDANVKKEASNHFKSNSYFEQDSVGSNDENGSINPCILVSITVFSFTIALLVMIGMILISNEQNNQFQKICNWVHYALDRNCYMSEVLLFSTITMLQVNGKLNLNFTSINITASSLNRSASNLLKSNDNLLYGLNGNIACVGINPTFDDLNINEQCVPNATGLYGTYQCSPIDKSVSLILTLVDGIVRNPNNITIEPGSYYAHIFSIANNHLIPPGLESANILVQSGTGMIYKYTRWSLILMICGIIYCFIAFSIFMFLVHKLDKAYNGFLQLFRRIPPLACNLNTDIIIFLLNRKLGKENTKMSAAQSAIMMSPDSIILFNRNETIDIINPSITELFGYTPNQLLGQSVNSLLPEEKNQTIFNQFELMRKGESNLTYEIDGLGKSDDDQEIPVHVTIIGFTDEGKTNANSFAIIIKDSTTLLKQRTEAEEAKKKSEKLLYNILPRDIVNRLNQGESEIFFSVKSASIIFIDIVKWSDYASNLTPSQIMSNLSLIFAAFDQSASRYDYITKIKLIGDVYMAASGLFTSDIQPSLHASQMINFALECLLDIEEVNSTLDTSLQIRIGINTDGPLLAGVLGTDKPVFDIIGDPINVASRLQSTCIPSTIQISQSTYNAISDMKYNIETRGEIELKGKGKKLAYIIRPSLASRSSSMIIKPEIENAIN